MWSKTKIEAKFHEIRGKSDKKSSPWLGFELQNSLDGVLSCPALYPLDHQGFDEKVCLKVGLYPLSWAWRNLTWLI